MEKTFFDSFRTGDYQRDNFDAFLKAIRFSYDVLSIHIAGTNGKGSTATYLANAYIANNYKVGLFKSPFLFEVNEMITINNQAISDDDFISIFNRYKKEINKYNLSAFEIQTLVAFTYFKEQHCDIAVIECGMGGELDATNIFTPVLSIVTTISLEHTDYLGHSISEVAFHKAGIIKESIPVLVGDLPEDAMVVISNAAKDCNSKLCYLGHFVNEEYSKDGYSFDYGEFLNTHILSKARYSINDAVLALEAVKVLQNRFVYDVEKVKEGLANVYMPCRMDIVKDNPLVIIDGAHNPEGVNKLCDGSSLHRVIGSRHLHVVFACFRDKNLGNMLARLGEITDDLTITTFDNPRARTEDEYFLFAGDYPFVENAKELIQNKINEYPEDAILITGSLAFAAYVKKLFLDGEIK